MSVAMEMHGRWESARARLWGASAPITKKRAVVPARSLPRLVVLPVLMDKHGWPKYQPPVFYDHFVKMQRLPPRTMKQIIREVASKHGLTVNDIVSPRHLKPLVMARHEAMWRCKRETSHSLPVIGRAFGGRDHTTVLNGIRMHEKRLRGEA